MQLWTSWRPEWVIHEDAKLLVVDKPPGMPTQPLHEVADVITRLREFRPDYVGLLHPLDRHMSGLVAVSRNASMNAALAAELARGVERSYLAVVRKLPKRVDGFNYESIGRKGERTLLRLSSKAPSQPVRRALSAAGAPVAGDVENGGEPAPRLMLHHERMALGGSTFEARAPDLRAWLEQRPLEGLLEMAIDRRYGIARRGDTNAFRLVNDAGDGLPGVEIDLYGEHAVVFVREGDNERVVDDLMRLGLKGVYLKRRPKKASDADTRALAPPHAVRGDDAPDPLIVEEAGLRYHVRLGDGLATGIFLDQRKNRELIRELAAGKSVLNLFGYTAAFTVAAAAGRAASSVTVDSSKTALARAAENLALNGAELAQHSLVQGDAMRWLERQKARFDLVIVDPPSFSTTRHSMFRAKRDYRDLSTAALRCLARGGSLLACTNHRGIGARELRGLLAAGARDLGIEVREMRTLPDPVDFPAPLGESCHLKSVLLVSAP